MRRLLVVGRGKVGTALARRARASKLEVRSLSARAVVSGEAAVARADLVVIATRDPDIEAVASGLVRHAGSIGAAVHCAGALGPEVLVPLARAGVSTAAAHPMLSFSGSSGPSLRGGALVIEGDVVAVRAATELARRLSMSPVIVSALDRARYHAAAAIVANGAAALAATGADVLVRAGIAREIIPAILGPLLASVARNVTELGPVRALSGPVRRGDASTVRRHLDVLDADVPATADLYRALVRLQVEIARDLTEQDEPGIRERDFEGLLKVIHRRSIPSEGPSKS